MPHFSDDSSWKILDLRQRGFFDGMLVLAGRSNNAGEICCDGMPGVPYTDDQLAASLCITTTEFRSVLATIPQDMVFRKPNGCLQVTNWANYQTEYERRKGYKTKLHPKVTPQSNTPLSDFQKSEVRSQKSEEQKREEELAALAYDLILQNHPNLPSFKKRSRQQVVESWATTVDRFLKATGIQPVDVDRFFRWLAQDVEVNAKPKPGRRQWCGWRQQFQSVNILDNDHAWASFSQGSMSQGYVHRSKR